MREAHECVRRVEGKLVEICELGTLRDKFLSVGMLMILTPMYYSQCSAVGYVRPSKTTSCGEKLVNLRSEVEG